MVVSQQVHALEHVELCELIKRASGSGDAKTSFIACQNIAVAFHNSNIFLKKARSNLNKEFLIRVNSFITAILFISDVAVSQCHFIQYFINLTKICFF